MSFAAFLREAASSNTVLEIREIGSMLVLNGDMGCLATTDEFWFGLEIDCPHPIERVMRNVTAFENGKIFMLYLTFLVGYHRSAWSNVFGRYN